MHLRVWASVSPAKEEVVYRRCTRGRQRAMLLLAWRWRTHRLRQASRFPLWPRAIQLQFFARRRQVEPTQLFGFGDQELQFFQGAGPVLAQQSGQRSVCEQLAACLARRAIVRFIGGITDALDFGAAARAGKFVAAVNGHAFAKRGDFFGEIASGLGTEMLGPARKAGADGFVEAMDFRDREFLSERKRREFGLPEDFVGVGIANSTEKARVGQGALERVVGREKRGGKLFRSG